MAATNPKGIPNLIQELGKGALGTAGAAIGLGGPIAPLAATLIPMLGSIGGGIAQRLMSRADIRRQNEYNSPVNQVARLKEAGLPMAALEGTANAGQQSDLPQSNDLGLTEAGGKINQYITTQAQLKQMQLLDEEIKLKGSEAKLREAETAWLLSGKGIDRAGTNLTAGMQTQLNYQQSQQEGSMLANELQKIVIGNAEKRQLLENQQLEAQIKQLGSQTGLTETQTESEEYHRNILKILSEYQPSMSNIDLAIKGQQYNLLGRNIATADLENAGLQIRNYIMNATKDIQISHTTANEILAWINSNEAERMFKNNSHYQQFVTQSREFFKDTDGKFTWGELAQQLGSIMYLVVGSQAGQMAPPTIQIQNPQPSNIYVPGPTPGNVPIGQGQQYPWQRKN